MSNKQLTDSQIDSLGTLISHNVGVWIHTDIQEEGELKVWVNTSNGYDYPNTFKITTDGAVFQVVGRETFRIEV